MNAAHLESIGTKMFGSKWKTAMADALGISAARMYQIASMSSIPEKTASKILSLTGNTVEVAAEPVLSEEEVAERINKRFSIMNRMVQGMIAGSIRSMIVSGAPGIGKTYDIERALRQAEKEKRIEKFDMIKGTVSPVGLYMALYEARDGGIIVIDDCDSIFSDEQALNILKGALDSSDQRTISWRKASSWVYQADGSDDSKDDEGRLPDRFDFNGSVIFVTNLDFEAMIAKDTKMSPHFAALTSRSLYLDLTLRTNMDRLVRIKDVFMGQMAKMEGLSQTEAKEVFEFTKTHQNSLMELSLRTMKHIAQLRKLGDDWKEIVKVTKFRKGVA